MKSISCHVVGTAGDLLGGLSRHRMTSPVSRWATIIRWNIRSCARHFLYVVVACLMAALGGCDSGPGDRGPTAPAAGSADEVVVLLAAGWSGSWPAGLDPATNTTARANLSQMNAIFGGLFQLVPSEGTREFEIRGVLAEGYEVRDGGRTLIIRLRRGLQFSDGMPLDASAVIYNIERSLSTPCSCAPTAWPWSEANPVEELDSLTVALRFSQPYGAAINSFPVSNINWIASPVAISSMSPEEFAIAPVGAGPFTVVSNELSTRLILERNPLYWEEGKPKLDRITFQSIGSEQAALQALLAGDAHIVEGATSTALIKRAQDYDELVVTQQPATSPYVIQLNTSLSPFDDKRAREAIYYATDVESIRQALFYGWYPSSQSFTGPGSLYHQASVDGYRTYDPGRARELVEELGGVQVTLGTLRSFVSEQVVTALQSQWSEAGIETAIEMYEVAPLIQKLRSGTWQAMLQTVGSFDPESGAGVSLRFRSDQLYSGVHDPEVDRLLAMAAAANDPAERSALYGAVSRYLSDQAYSPFLFAFAPTQFSRAGIEGPGLTTEIPPISVNTGILWQDVEFVDR